MNFTESNETKRKMISSKTELSKLKKLFKSAPESVKKLTQPLIENAAFMAEQLDILQEEITKAGSWTETYRNGANQTGKKMSAAAQAYNQLIKNYSKVIKDLYSYLPEQAVTSAATEDEFQRFIRKGIR